MKRTMKSLIVLLAYLSVFLPGCADELDPPSRITELRLLAVQADTPFAQAGQTVHLHALAVDPDNRRLSWAWGTCIDATSSLALDCLRGLSFDELTIGEDLTTHTLVVPSTDAPSVGVAIVVCPGAIVRGQTEGIPVSCLDESGAARSISAFEIGLKRLYNRDSSLNHNPVIDRISWDGEPWLEGEVKQDSCKRQAASGCTAYTEHRITVTAPDAAETSLGADASGPEQAIVSFFASGGEFDDEVRFYDDAETKWHARREDGARLQTFWFVLRDDRGGVSWTSRQVQTP
ncbi:MAG: hypothetical protein JWN48_5228 [Myxococcaceae bacterium]|nr:hypothetical protein [Myxococcaceae bacterium]